ncbi:CHASE2 domain-containing protein [Caenimonas aquaedulcis]|uniref:Adenylate/guanylate cyclase domain-containing protein n=1 Tax=Caenimonas aquaedulcis TaxID=2793270 RepID=A0A931H719_9BURK|nr:adenylate/guanylate cyclase domain-containing protein [Caenimonas aquaedulcis]MBG9389786.1 adenylate/guanylate cyclase domain-containing protein [Caenimonas aquaedulcis]
MIRGLGRSLLHPWRTRMLAVAIAVIGWLAIALLAPVPLHQADERATDLIWQLSGDTQQERRVVVVDIDDASLQRIGAWPWSRQTQARLVTALREQGATLQLYDIVFPDARQGTDELAAAIAASDSTSPAVLAQVFSLNRESRQTVGELAGALPGDACMPSASPATGFVANVAGLGTRAGHITPRLDPDGSVRRVPALVCYGQRNYPALALAGLAAFDTSGKVPMRIEPGTRPWDPAWTLTMSAMPDIKAPLDANGDLRVPYRKARNAIVSVSAADVLEGKLGATNPLRGAWALVGASAFGLGDTVPTALGGAVSGVEVHAQLLSGLLDGAVPATPRAVHWIESGWFVVGLLVLLALSATRSLPATDPQRRRPGVRVLWVPLAAVGLGVLGFILHAAALLGAGWWLGWAHASLAIVLVGLCLGFAEHARSLAEKGLLFRNLSSYLPAAVAERIALAEPTGEIEADRRDLTVVVADVRNFSAYCEARSPEDAARVLHRFYTTASAIVQAHGGAVEEMVGDSLIAVFNGSQPCVDHPMHALSAAREIWQRCSEELPNVPPQGLEPLGLGVGVESGTALLGSFGPAGRRVHAVLGQTITIAIRLQDMTAELAYPVLVGPQAAERIGVPFERSDLALKPLGSFLLPGLRHSTKVFTLRTLMQPGGDAEQQSLRYLQQQGHLAA